MTSIIILLAIKLWKHLTIFMILMAWFKELSAYSFFTSWFIKPFNSSFSGIKYCVFKIMLVGQSTWNVPKFFGFDATIEVLWLSYCKYHINMERVSGVNGIVMINIWKIDASMKLPFWNYAFQRHTIRACEVCTTNKKRQRSSMKTYRASFSFMDFRFLNIFVHIDVSMFLI